MTDDTPRLRLFVADRLHEGGAVAPSREQNHYLLNVMRLRPGECVGLFNGSDGEWLARAEAAGKAMALLPIRRLRPQASEPDLWLLAAPLRKERIDLVAEKAAELGASALWPVFTRNTAMGRVNTQRLGARMIEAAEQCGRLGVPEIFQPATLEKALAGWDPARLLLWPDEGGSGLPIAEALRSLPPGPLAVLIGPEGGFAPPERAMLATLSFVRPLSLGPRILRAETAAIAALACIQALVGDWNARPEGWQPIG